MSRRSYLTVETEFVIMQLDCTAFFNESAEMALLFVGALNADNFFYVEALPKAGETVRVVAMSGPHVGGKGANQAAMAGILALDSRDVKMLGCVGDDPEGKLILREMVVRGVDVSRVKVCQSERSGTAMITVDSKGENTILIHAASNGRFSVDDFVDEVFEQSKLVVCQNEISFDVTCETLRRAKAVGSRTIFNMAPPSQKEAVQQGLAFCDVLVVNESEAASLLDDNSVSCHFEDAAARLSKLVPFIIITAGAKGCLVSSSSGQKTWVTSRFKVTQVIDTAGAGDCFVGSLAWKLHNLSMQHDKKEIKLSFESLCEAARFGCCAASLSVQRKGCQVSYPTLDEIAADS